MTRAILTLFFAFFLVLAGPVRAQDRTPLLDGRVYDIHVPQGLAPEGQRSLLVALHGGTGWSSQFERSIGLDEAADKHKFIVLYLNGTRAGQRLPERRRAWNAGTCCGLPAKSNIDDLGYIVGATQKIVSEYGIHPHRVFVTGHSNGAMMSARLMCEASLFQSAVLIAGALNVPGADCRAARGKNLLAVHGVDDANYPINGGVGPKSIAKTDFVSQSESKAVFETAGAAYNIVAVQGAEHKTESVSQGLVRQTGKDLPETIVSFLGLDRR